MSDIFVEQAVLLGDKDKGFRMGARSGQFAEEWIPLAEKACSAFGQPPEGVTCPAALYVQPLGKRHVAVIRVATPPGAPNGELAFHLAVLKADEYEGLGGDPFTIAEQCPPAWDATGELPTLSWPRVSFPARTVQEVQRVLKRPDGPNLLGGSQVLLDGGKIVFERTGPDSQVLRDLWTLLPTRSRSEMWPATFAFSNSAGFHAVVVPEGTPKRSAAEFPHYVNEEHAGDYPEGRYELRLQTAAEAGDQDGLDMLFARRTSSEMWRLGLLLLAAMILFPILISWFTGSGRRADPSQPAAASSASDPAAKADK